MRVVYWAHDSKLKRRVDVKALTVARQRQLSARCFHVYCIKYNIREETRAFHRRYPPQTRSKWRLLITWRLVHKTPTPQHINLSIMQLCSANLHKH